jgi:hypothetical protein
MKTSTIALFMGLMLCATVAKAQGLGRLVDSVYGPYAPRRFDRMQHLRLTPYHGFFPGSPDPFRGWVRFTSRAQAGGHTTLNHQHNVNRQNNVRAYFSVREANRRDRQTSRSKVDHVAEPGVRAEGRASGVSASR